MFFTPKFTVTSTRGHSKNWIGCFLCKVSSELNLSWTVSCPWSKRAPGRGSKLCLIPILQWQYCCFSIFYLTLAFQHDALKNATQDLAYKSCTSRRRYRQRPRSSMILQPYFKSLEELETEYTSTTSTVKEGRREQYTSTSGTISYVSHRLLAMKSAVENMLRRIKGSNRLVC